MDTETAKKILIVNNEAALQKSLFRSVERMGYRAVLAENVAVALDILASASTIDCILLDIPKLRMAGRQALRQLHSRHPSIPVLLLTACGTMAGAIDAIREGAANYLATPVSFEVLKKTIHHALRQSATFTQDAYIRDHCMRVATVSIAIAKEMQKNAAFIQRLECAALLHDIGKTGIPSVILHKQGALEPQEYSRIQAHSIIGAQMLSHSDFFMPCIDAVRQHHERWDGSGYPQGLSGENIDAGARIIAVADSFDAMTSARPYRASRPHEEAREEILRCCGAQFDPEVVRAFESSAAYLL